MRRQRKGQHFVEFALALPLFTTLFFGIMEVGFLFYQDHTVNSAARRGARLGAVGNTDATITTFVQNYCVGFNVPAAAISVVVTDANGVVQPANTRTSGMDVRVTVTHNLTFLTFLKETFQRVGTTQVVSSSQFVIE